MPSVPNGHFLPEYERSQNGMQKIIDLLSTWVRHLAKRVSENGFSWGSVINQLPAALLLLERIKRRPKKADGEVLHHLCETYRVIQPYNFRDFKGLVTAKSLHAFPEETKHVIVQLIFDGIIQGMIKEDGEGKLGEKLDGIERACLATIATYVGTEPTKGDKLRDDSTSLEQVNAARRRFLLELWDIDVNEEFRSIDDWLAILIDGDLQEALIDLETQMLDMAKSIRATRQYAKAIKSIKARRSYEARMEYKRILNKNHIDKYGYNPLFQ